MIKPRSNIFAAILTKVVPILVILVFVYALDNFVITHSDAADSDFSYLWAGGYAVDTGHSLYDPTAIANIFHQIGHGRIDPAVAFPYPLWVVLLFIPLGWLPYLTAATLWALFNQICFLVAFLWFKSSLRHQHDFTVKQARRWNDYLVYGGLIPFMLTPHFIHSLLNGQTSFLMLALIAGFIFYATKLASRPSKFNWRKPDTEVWAGLFLLGWLFKPPLILILLPLTLLWLFMQRQWRIIFTFAIGLVFLALISFAIYPTWLQGWLASRTPEGFSAFINSANIWGMTEELGSNYGFQSLALPLAGLIFVGLAFLNWKILYQSRFWKTNPVLTLSLLGAFGLATTFYSHNYDQLILFLPGLALLDFGLSLSKMQRWLVWLNLLFILVIIPWSLNLQALTHTVSGFYALSLNLFALLLIALTKPNVNSKKMHQETVSVTTPLSAVSHQLSAKYPNG